MGSSSNSQPISLPGTDALHVSTDLDPTDRLVRVPVAGMTCAACEKRVGKALRSVRGVQAVTVSRRAGIATLTVSRPPSHAALAAALDRAGYSLGPAPVLTRDRTVWRTVIVTAVAVAFIAATALALGVGDLPALLADPARGGIALVLVLGLTAGVSTCMALVGGLVLAVSASHAAALAGSGRPTPGLAVRMRPHLAFNGGRILGFGLLGSLLGVIGASVSLPTRLMGALVLAVAIVMALLGLRLTEVSPRLGAWTVTLPGGVARALGVQDAADSSYSHLRAALLGAATFFLPCGFTQAVQLYALSAASPLTSGLIMAVFAVGTTPGLLALAAVPEVATGARRTTVLRVVGVVVVAFALLNAAGGLALLGVGVGRAGTQVSAERVSSNVSVSGGVQTVRMTQTQRGYEPADTVVHAGIPIRWEITATSQYSCSAFLRMPDLGVKADLKDGVNVVELPALAPGETTFTCVMGMYSGRLIAIDAPSAPTTGATGATGP